MQLLRLNDATIDAAWSVLGDYAHAYDDNGGSPDGNAWLPRAEADNGYEQANIANALAAGLGEMVEAEELDTSQLMTRFGYNMSSLPEHGSMEEADLLENLRDAANTRLVGWAHYGTYAGVDDVWIIQTREAWR